MINRSTKQHDDYTGYRGLPPIVDLMPVSDAIEKGLTVAESVDRLKYLNWALRRLHNIFIARIPAEPIYELKMAYSLHAHVCIEHVGEIAARVREMREPPYGLDHTPHEALDRYFDEILCAPDSASLVLGLYEKAIPAVVHALKAQIDATNLLFEHPTYRVLRWTLIEVEEAANYGAKAVTSLITAEVRAMHADWLERLDALLSCAGGMDGTAAKSDTLPDRLYSVKPYVFDPEPKRDERFQDLYNMGVNAEAFLHDPAQPALPKTLMLYFKRMREIDVPEMMASIIYETPDKPYGYYKDMTRQLWDEARHAMMGELGFISVDIDWTTLPFTIAWSLNLNTKLTAKERHAVLFFIEQGLMPNKTGKKAEWEIAVAAATPIAELIQDYDWADEILHARVGRDWLVNEIGTQAEAMEFGDRSWAKANAEVPEWEKLGLTEHRNWWPDTYRAACRHWGIEPDPNVLAFNESYVEKRADLKPVE